MLPVIERYEIAEELGHGGMATVYRARDRRLDRWVAVKVMHPHLRGTEEARARFSREARAVAKLKQRAILEVYDYSDNESDNAYIATELLTGPTLKAFVDAQSELPAEIAACIGVELALALSEAHAHGIVHRDVKPENVLLHEQNFVKLTDFGIADMLEPNVSAMTATGQILGSPFHMAPEQVEGGDSDARSDVFSLGTILYWMASGSLPFPGKNPHQVLKRVVDCNPTDPLIVKPAMGRPLRDIIMRCLAKDPAARFASAQDLATSLETLLRGLAIEDSQAELRRYLHDPAGEALRLREHVIAHLLLDARRCMQRKDRMAAIDRLDRVLALDDGNALALALVRALDRSSKQRFFVRYGLLLLAMSALAALWFSFGPTPVATSKRGAGLSPEGSPKPREADNRDKQSIGSVAPIAAAPKVTPERERQPESEPARQPEPETAGLRPVRLRPRPSGPRTVVFDHEPANVTIRVDGAVARPFGPAFRMLELDPGLHTFRFEGAHGCCAEREVKVNVPPGPGQTVVRVELPFRAAKLYVVGDVPADVRVGDGVAEGRTRSLIDVPITRALTESQRISVTAPGYAPYTGTVQLRAGQVTQLNVDLVPSAPR